ncbi:MAG: hydroxymethylglutaryl-CoA reductase, partial [Planctomycetota bacterium]
VDGGVRFGLKNRLRDASLTRIAELRINDGEIPLERLVLNTDAGFELKATEVSPESPVPFPLSQVVHLLADSENLDTGRHRIELAVETEPFGPLRLAVEDAIAGPAPARNSVPYDKQDDYSPRMIRERQDFVRSSCGMQLEHIDKYSFDPRVARGNIENFTGVAQVPLAVAGPLHVRGEHARGQFLIPMATTEGTVVASYNRGIKVLNLAGGVTCTVLYESMQRAPVFVFDSAREARDFKIWIDENFDGIREAAEATSNVARLKYIDPFHANQFVFLRFNYTTGDAAGQNMVGRATFAACSWIMDRVTSARKFYLESNLATDKKTSHVNIMRTRGRRVVAEAKLSRALLEEHLHVDPENLVYHCGVANVGAFLSGANNNGCQSPNAITAMFIATGQDVANVAESSAGIFYCELTPQDELHVSLTIPSLIVATHGGGTGLPTQRECLEMLDCYGAGKVNRLAEIVAGVALAGEISLGSAISSLDWVSSHEKHGRNR